jgi:hypothetical protein
MSTGLALSSKFPLPSPALEALGFKFSSGGAHISRTMMLTELIAVLINLCVALNGSSGAVFGYCVNA